MAIQLGHGVYSIAEAARLTRLRAVRLGEWFGRTARSQYGSLLCGDYQPVDGDYAISFHDMIDAFVAGQLCEHGVSLQVLREVVCRLRSDLNTTHPFCRQELLTDGKRVFLRGLDCQGQEEMMEVLNRQRVFPEILVPFLKKIDYGEATKLAERWRISRLVVIDPAIGFGKPIVEPVGIATAVLAAAFRANDEDAERVASWYNIHSSHVLAAAEFERSLAA